MTVQPTEYALPESNDALLAECDVHVFRSSGPGGQSVNTTDSAVRLVHRPSGITVTCQRERSQHRNKQECLRRLRERIEAWQFRPTPRVPTKPTGVSRERRLAAKRQVAEKKRARRRVRPSDAD